MSINPANTEAPFLQTSNYFIENYEQFRVDFQGLYQNIANMMNIREIAIYDLVENLTGQQWFVSGDPQNTRQTFRNVYEIGAIAAGATATKVHNLAVSTFTKISGTAITAVPDFRPIPFSSATAVNQQIEIRVDATNIIIVNGAGAPNITSALVILEYLKN